MDDKTQNEVRKMVEKVNTNVLGLFYGKIKVRVVLSHNGKVGKDGKRRVELCLYQPKSKGQKRMYINTNIYVYENCFCNGTIISDRNAFQYNIMLCDFIKSIFEFEIKCYEEKKYVTLDMIKTAINGSAMPNTPFVDFAKKVVENSDRKESTKAGYDVFLNNFSKYRTNVLLEEIDYNFIKDYDKWLKESGVSENTRIGRLQQFKTIMQEAVKHDVIEKSPFCKFRIPSMINKKGFLTEKEIEAIENLSNLTKIETHVMYAFLFCYYTGLRFSDFKTLKQSDIKDGWVRKKMVKTGKFVEIPIAELFDGKAMKIIVHYNGNIENLIKKIGQNGSMNQVLKRVFQKAGIDPTNKSFHIARHSCASNLISKGLPITTIQKILGHTKISTSLIYAEVTKETIINDLKRQKKNNKKK